MKALSKINEENYQAIVLYCSGTDNVELSDTQKRILDRWREAHHILRKHPRKSVAAKMLQSLYPELSTQQAWLDVESAMRLWNLTEKQDREFLDIWYVNALLKEIENPASPPAVRAKNLQTLGAWLKNLPPVSIDPRLAEKNQVNIVFNVDNRSVNFTEAELLRLKLKDRERLLSSIPSNLDEAQAAEILES
jgi:hypothetical protein